MKQSSLFDNIFVDNFACGQSASVARGEFNNECERLQTLPDNYTEGVSNTQRYKCIGNGWTVEVIAHILSYIDKSNSAVKYIQMSLFDLIKR